MRFSMMEQIPLGFAGDPYPCERRNIPRRATYFVGGLDRYDFKSLTSLYS